MPSQVKTNQTISCVVGWPGLTVPPTTISGAVSDPAKATITFTAADGSFLVHPVATGTVTVTFTSSVAGAAPTSDTLDIVQAAVPGHITWNQPQP